MERLRIKTYPSFRSDLNSQPLKIDFWAVIILVTCMTREFINSVKFYLDKMQPIICSNKSKEQLTNKDRIKEHFITDKQTNW